jgi:hypothetical protein
MLQMDGSNHKWFPKDNENYTIHGAIDDAESIVTGLYMCKNECMEGYIQVMRETIKNYGVPKSAYLDGLSIFYKLLTIRINFLLYQIEKN